MFWLQKNWLEIIGVISGLLFLYFEYKENALLWPLGIITSSVYIAVFFLSKIYADMAINVYYVVIGIYGWLNWIRKKSDNTQNNVLKISKTPTNVLIALITISLALYFIIAYILTRYTDSNVPKIDAFTTSLSIVATWMLTQKYVQHWIFWIIINGVSCGLYIYKELHFTTGLFFVYTIMSVLGYIEWKKKLNAYVK